MLMRTKDRFGEPLRGRRPALRTRRRNDAGYTLLELLVVMGILAALTAVATPQLMGYFGKAKTQSVQLQIENIGGIDLHQRGRKSNHSNGPAGDLRQCSSHHRDLIRTQLSRLILSDIVEQPRSAHRAHPKNLTKQI